ncbi:DUF1573 domain-containing protein [Myxococcota bacterium]|nr:DUF1573 domain-containing protein [Myxococcota bacterium]
MKHLTFMMALLTGFVAFVASAQAQPVARFESTEIDYGKIAAGSNPVREFKFKNFGTEPLLITDAQGSSGAVIPSWPPAPIMPGMSEVVRVTYDTKRIGPFKKFVTLTTNDPKNPQVRLTIVGEVIRKPEGL